MCEAPLISANRKRKYCKQIPNCKPSKESAFLLLDIEDVVIVLSVCLLHLLFDVLEHTLHLGIGGRKLAGIDNVCMGFIVCLKKKIRLCMCECVCVCVRACACVGLILMCADFFFFICTWYSITRTVTLNFS